MLYFADRDFVRPLLPVVDRVLEYFHSKVDRRGLVYGMPPHHWQYIDWAFRRVGTDEHTDGGVKVVGRKSNTHTYLACYLARATVNGVTRHCFDGSYFTDSTADANRGYPPSQHCQVWVVICGAVAPGSEQARQILRDAFDPRNDFTKCSYTMMHYVFRALSLAGVYEEMWPMAWVPWRQMIAKNLSTWEEDEVRLRSDCLAWGSVALYEYPVEVAGVQPLEPGWTKVLFPHAIITEPVHHERARDGQEQRRIRQLECR